MDIAPTRKKSNHAHKSIITITGTGTDVGKTFVGAHIAYNFTKSGHKIRAIKPIVTGFDDAKNDAKELIISSGNIYNEHTLNDASRWRLKTPAALPIAAAAESLKITLEEIFEFCMAATSCDHRLILETAGGIMSPLIDCTTNLDLICMINNALGPQAFNILVCDPSYLGSISHTLTALESAKKAGIKISLLAINQKTYVDGANSIHDLIRSYCKTETIYVVQHKDSWQFESDIADVIRMQQLLKQ